jgi:hypothetical protein
VFVRVSIELFPWNWITCSRARKNYIKVVNWIGGWIRSQEAKLWEESYKSHKFTEDCKKQPSIIIPEWISSPRCLFCNLCALSEFLIKREYAVLWLKVIASRCSAHTAGKASCKRNTSNAPGRWFFCCFYPTGVLRSLGVACAVFVYVYEQGSHTHSALLSIFMT